MVVYECSVDSLKQSKDTFSRLVARREHPNSIIHRIYESISKVQATVECVSHDNGGLSTLIHIFPSSSYISLKVIILLWVPKPPPETMVTFLPHLRLIPLANHPPFQTGVPLWFLPTAHSHSHIHRDIYIQRHHDTHHFFLSETVVAQTGHFCEHLHLLLGTGRYQ